MTYYFKSISFFVFFIYLFNYLSTPDFYFYFSLGFCFFSSFPNWALGLWMSNLYFCFSYFVSISRAYLFFTIFSFFSYLCFLGLDSLFFFTSSTFFYKFDIFYFRLSLLISFPLYFVFSVSLFYFLLENIFLRWR